MDIQPTSIEAYLQIKGSLSDRQDTVYKFLLANPNSCNLEISQGLDWPINTVTPRVNELRKLNLVEKSGTKQSTTGRTAITWRVVI